MKYCEGLDCMICDEKEPCIYKRANELQECLDKIEEYCKEQNLKYDTTACDILRIIEEIKGNG